MKLLSDYFNLQNQIFEYFGYVEDWRVLPVDDATKYYWTLDGDVPEEGMIFLLETISETTLKRVKEFGTSTEVAIAQKWFEAAQSGDFSCNV